MTGAEDPEEQAGESSAQIQPGDPQPASSGAAPAAAGCSPGPAALETAGAIASVTEHELTEVEAGLCAEDFTDTRQQAMMQNLTRRQQDQRFLQQLAAAGFTGAMWDYFANELAAYGVPVLMSWTRTGKIGQLCADKGRPIAIPPVDWSAEDRLGLTVLTVAKAINVFRDKVLRPGGWDPGHGTTIKTFFMGAVILQFPNHYNSWRREELRSLIWPGPRALEDTLALTKLHADRPDSDPARTAITRTHLVQILSDMPEDLRIACLLMLEGDSVKDAAAAIGKTGDALSEQLRRYRNGRGRKMR